MRRSLSRGRMIPRWCFRRVTLRSAHCFLLTYSAPAYDALSCNCRLLKSKATSPVYRARWLARPRKLPYLEWESFPPTLNGARLLLPLPLQRAGRSLCRALTGKFRLQETRAFPPLEAEGMARAEGADK